MTNIVSAVIIGGLTSGGIIATSAITGETQVPLKIVAGFFVFSSGLIWTAGRFLQRMHDDIKEIKRQVKSLPCNDPLAGKKCPAKYETRLKKLAKLVGMTHKEETSTT